jgi:hypothetical protein
VSVSVPTCTGVSPEMRIPASLVVTVVFVCAFFINVAPGLVGVARELSLETSDVW